MNHENDCFLLSGKICEIAARNDDLEIAISALNIFVNYCDIVESKNSSNEVVIKDGHLLKCNINNYLYCVPSDVKTIDDNAFINCNNLQRLIIPSSVTSIKINAFSNLNNLYEIVFLEDINKYEDFLFDPNCSLVQYNPLNNSQISDAKDDNEVSNSKSSNDNIKSKNGCYIATAVYGSYDAPEVLVLRSFRDNVLKKSVLGRVFIKIYYFLSPPIAKRLHNFRHINQIVKCMLDKFVASLLNSKLH